VAGWRSLRAVTHNYLVTFTSRYRDREGWWLFGLVESSLDGWRMDLLSDIASDPTPIGQLREDAIRCFDDQMAKQGLPVAILRHAKLACARGDSSREFAGQYPRDGHWFRFDLMVETVHGQRLTSSVNRFVAPHDPRYERQAGRGE